MIKFIHFLSLFFLVCLLGCSSPTEKISSTYDLSQPQSYKEVPPLKDTCAYLVVDAIFSPSGSFTKEFVLNAFVDSLKKNNAIVYTDSKDLPSQPTKHALLELSATHLSFHPCENTLPIIHTQLAIITMVQVINSKSDIANRIWETEDFFQECSGEANTQVAKSINGLVKNFVASYQTANPRTQPVFYVDLSQAPQNPAESWGFDTQGYPVLQSNEK